MSALDTIAKWMGIGIGLLLFFVAFVTVFGMEQTVKTIEYPIGFVATAQANTLYGKNITFNPPDGVLEILSGEIFLRGDFQANTKVYARIGNQFCNPAGWQTPNQDIGNYQIIFDCSELLEGKTGGTQEVNFMVDKTALNLYGRYKITYYNNPKGSMGIFGTEYNIGDKATIFLQLKDSQDLPVNSGNCYLDIFYPNIQNQTHPTFLNSISMLYKNGSNGLYYYDFILSNYTGVYMLSASCSYIYDVAWYYSEDDYINYPNRTVIGGTYSGSPLVLNAFQDFLYTECSSGAGKNCEAYYDFNITGYGNATNIDLHYSGESTSKNTMDFYVWNWTSSSWIILPNSLSFQTASPSITGVDEFISNPISLDDTVSDNKTIRIRTATTSGSTFTQWDNWISLKILTSEGSITEIKGSGEIHVSDLFSNLTVQLENQSDLIGNIWNYTNRSIDASWDEAKFVGGTEYSSGEIGKASVQLIKTIAGNPEPVITATCSVDIYYPNETLMISNGNAPYVSGSDGIYTYNFTVPSTEGIYIEEFNCTDGPKKYYASGTFHTSKWANTIFEINSTIYMLNQSQYNQYISLFNKISDVNTSITNLRTYIGNINWSIMQKLYMIQDDLDGLLQNLTVQLANVTNVTLNITGTLNEVALEVWELFFIRGTPPLAPSTEYYCAVNNSNILLKNITYDYRGGAYDGYFSKVEEIYCDYGCDTANNMCYLPPYQRWGIIIVITLALLLLITFLVRRYR